MTPVLDYASESKWFPWQRAIKIVLIVAAILFALALPFIEMRREVVYIDVITGSVATQTYWPRGYTTGAKVTLSPLALRLEKMNVVWTPSWRLLNINGCSTFGNTLTRGCNPAPATVIFSSQSVPVDFLSDADVMELIGVMKSGTDDDQRWRLERIFLKLTKE